MPIRILLDDERARRIRAQPPPPLQRQLGRKLESARPLYRLEGHLKVGNGFPVINRRVGQHKRPQRHIPPLFPVLGKDDLVKVRGDGDGRRRANHFVLYIPLVIRGILAGQIQGPRDDAHRGVAPREAAAEIFKVRPVVAVEALADLGAHVGQVKGLVHGLLGPLGVGGGDLVAPVVAAAVVVLEAGAELGRHGVVLEKGRVLAVGVAAGERGGRDVLDHPVRVARAAVVAGDEGGAAGDVGDGAWEAVFEETGWVDGVVVVGWDAAGERAANGVRRWLCGGIGTGEACECGGGLLELLLLLCLLLLELVLRFGSERVDGGCQGSTTSSTDGGNHGNGLF